MIYNITSLPATRVPGSRRFIQRCSLGCICTRTISFIPAFFQLPYQLRARTSLFASTHTTMFPTAKRTFLFLLRTPLIPPPPPTPTFELTTLRAPPAGPSRPRATSSFSGYQIRGYASESGKKELYSDEAGSTGAGVSDPSLFVSCHSINDGWADRRRCPYRCCLLR